VQRITIGRDDAGQRLDRFLRKFLAAATLGHIFKLVRKGRVRVNGETARPGIRLVEGDELTLQLSDEQLADFRAPVRDRGHAGRTRSSRRSGPPRILHRDEHVLAVDKPAMLLSQPADDPDEPSLDRLVLDLVGEGDAHTFRPALAHRLDRGTSGVVLFGLSAPGLRGLTEAFRQRRVVKRYLALVAGAPEEEAFRVDLPLAPDPSDERRGKRMKVYRGDGALTAETEFQVLERRADGAFTLLECRPLTGRTHQIRAHLRAVRLPIVGDRTYGDPRQNERWRAQPGIWRQFLHAWRVELDHPVLEDVRLDVHSPLPEDLERTLKWAGLSAPRARRRPA
jgi:23S rRNA pseudouridine955/2504/2580 synthase